MTAALPNLPIAEADQLARQQVEHHRQQMSTWRQARARRIAQERATGRTVADIAADIGVHQQVVYELLREAKKAS
ncbi:hypothetical protein AMIS_19880 [Actinoplanes missouriensis 431]|uniref:Uncharacterized protein n=1 Tax=Actinoplanes missouriensis (strain ATCC 14538 / DSM 43046 / CBS 188.64 / JCM 3121 / NBRC 102363 / NCIMB 12654 / NRRL B-3342 / UNCC 431) TaxID=512565 RepID=I0H2H1_ACTM4|nr:hypothetical protein [Actinoplanes missouriensis]BAL87208.1 hypothetical protein AMIS_19880 [Actinoplanes missouriensis 431]